MDIGKMLFQYSLKEVDFVSIYSNDYKIVIFIDKYNYMETVVIEQLIAVISLYYNSIILEWLYLHSLNKHY